MTSDRLRDAERLLMRWMATFEAKQWPYLQPVPEQTVHSDTRSFLASLSGDSPDSGEGDIEQFRFLEGKAKGIGEVLAVLEARVRRNRDRRHMLEVAAIEDAITEVRLRLWPKESPLRSPGEEVPNSESHPQRDGNRA